MRPCALTLTLVCGMQQTKPIHYETIINRPTRNTAHVPCYCHSVFFWVASVLGVGCGIQDTQYIAHIQQATAETTIHIHIAQHNGTTMTVLSNLSPGARRLDNPE
jgi:hypothetical protein